MTDNQHPGSPNCRTQTSPLPSIDPATVERPVRQEGAEMVTRERGGKTGDTPTAADVQ